MVLTIYHLGHSQSDRAVFLCEELGIEYELKKYDRSPLMAPPDYKSLHPQGSAPVIGDGGVKLAESEACIEYIINIYGQGRLVVPPGEKNYPDYLYWYHIANGSLQPTVGRVMTLRFAGVKEDNPTYTNAYQKLLHILQMIDDRLAQVPWLAGNDFTAADIMMVFSLTTMREFSPYDLSPYTHILAYLERVVNRPGYQRALQKGDPDLDITQYINGPPPPLFPALQALQAQR